MLEELNNKIKEAEIVEDEIIEDTIVKDADIEESAPAVEEAVVEEKEVEKTNIVEAPADAPNVISSPKPTPGNKPGLGYLENGVMGSTTVPKKFDKKPAKSAAVKEDSEKVAIHSTRNVTWSEVGKVYRGYNIVTKEQADRWLTRDHTRLATPEEVAKEFNN
jgi:hypothetical protein